MNTSKNSKQTLIDALCRIDKPEDMACVLECILSEKEIKEVENRLQIFEMLDQKIAQREIANSLGVGIATVSRGANAYKKGQFLVLKQYLMSMRNN